MAPAAASTAPSGPKPCADGSSIPTLEPPLRFFLAPGGVRPSIADRISAASSSSTPACKGAALLSDAWADIAASAGTASGGRGTGQALSNCLPVCLGSAPLSADAAWIASGRRECLLEAASRFAGGPGSGPGAPTERCPTHAAAPSAQAHPAAHSLPPPASGSARQRASAASHRACAA